ncbi:MAG TPA: heme peroxidase family protein [Pyrinomonadaceae bacterium]|jgi:hypothetical protein
MSKKPAKKGGSKSASKAGAAKAASAKKGAASKAAGGGATAAAPGAVAPTTENPKLAKEFKPAEAAKFFRDLFRFHGDRPRGADFFPKSPSFEGRFGRMFRALPSALFDEEDLRKLAQAMVAEREPTDEGDEKDPEENRGIDAGYTYLGQFIDHDLTFDPASSLQKQNDPDALVDFRTPRFDLDCIYGRGPDDQPYLYEDDQVRMLLGRELSGVPHDPQTRDLPRNDPPGGRARALIGDPRNDENVIVSQLQATFLRFHNRVAQVLPTLAGKQSLASDPAELLRAVQREVRFHYQWVVVNDFLPTICGEQMVRDVLPSRDVVHNKPNLKFFRWQKYPYMPVEFSAAAYRFGHSMVRPSYRLNTTLPVRFDILGEGEFTSLTGFRAFPDTWAIDWSLFFNMRPDAPEEGPERLQKAYKIDTSLVNPLGQLPFVIAPNVPSLAERNLLRGLRMGLPSGQDVARFMGETPLPDDRLRVGKATAEDSGGNPLLTDISPRFAGKAPLWYYVLAEAQQQFDGNDDTPIRLGPVGGRIVTEVFVGLLYDDKHSYLWDTAWEPMAGFKTGDRFGIVDLIRQAMQA